VLGAFLGVACSIAPSCPVTVWPNCAGLVVVGGIPASPAKSSAAWSIFAARILYARVPALVSLVYGDHDWSQPQEREADLALLRGAQSIYLPATGHFAALEKPARVAEILLERSRFLTRGGETFNEGSR
jgi:hypothetical protein